MWPFGRSMERREPRNPELERAMVARPDDETAWAVYADWFADRGEPRGELIRLQLQRRREDEAIIAKMDAEPKRFLAVQRTDDRLARERREGQLISTNWARWFGDVPAAALGTSWGFGFVSHAAFGDARSPRGFGGDVLARLPEKVSCADVLRLPTLRFLRHVKISATDELELDGFEASPLLRRAWLFCASGAPLQRMLLKKRPAPALRQLRYEAGGGELAGVISALVGSALLEKLEDLTLKTLSPAAAEMLLERRGAFQRLGAGLHLVASEECLKQRRSELRSALPRAQLSPPPPARTGSFRFHGEGPRAHATPRRAPANFRELPPVQEIRTPEGETIRVGSGVPMEPHERFTRCMGCAGNDTLRIYSSYECKPGRTENYIFAACEYVCRECGMSTEWEYSADTG